MIYCTGMVLTSTAMLVPNSVSHRHWHGLWRISQTVSCLGIVNPLIQIISIEQCTLLVSEHFGELQVTSPKTLFDVLVSVGIVIVFNM